MNSAYLDQLRACCRDQAAFEQMQQILAIAQTQQQSQALAEALDQLNKSRTQLLQSEKLSHLGQLVAGIAHEINNPVNFICGNLNCANQYTQQLIELLALYQQEHTTPSPALQQKLEELNLILEDFPKLLASMSLGGERIRQIVLSLRNFSRLDASEMQPTNLHEGIDSTLLILHHRLKPQSNFRGINVVCEYGNVPLVECYPNQINQVFMNLLSNAIDALEDMGASETDTAINTIQYLPYRPQITIRTLQIPDPQGGNPRVIICIADNGNGIPLEIQARLFEPFFTTKAIGKGTGLGLSISRDIINAHGGDLQCYSQPGEGSEFWIELPVKQVMSAPEHWGDAASVKNSADGQVCQSQASDALV